jgi:hypothetical protein
MTTESRVAVEKVQKLSKKLKKLQAKISSSSPVSEDDQAAIAKLQKKLSKLKKQQSLGEQPPDVSPSTVSEDTAVATPADSSDKSTTQKNKKRKLDAGGPKLIIFDQHFCSSSSSRCICFWTINICLELR